MSTNSRNEGLKSGEPEGGGGGRELSVAPRRAPQELHSLAPRAHAHHEEGVAEKAERDLTAATRVEPGGGQAEGLLRPEHAARVKESDELQLDHARQDRKSVG